MLRYRIGSFRGIPVYKTTINEWNSADIKEDIIYVIESMVFYHGMPIGRLGRNNELTDFNEERFEDLRNRDWGRSYAEMLADATNSPAETAPQEEGKPVLSDMERAAAHQDIVGQFMLGWQDNIDNEIDKLKEAISAIKVDNEL